MTFTWKRLSVYSIAIDGQPCTLSPNSLQVDVKEGIHRVEILVSRTSVSKLRKKILMNWISIVFGLVEGTLDKLLSYARDDKISFDLNVVDCDVQINLDDDIPARRDLTSVRIPNSRKFRLIRNLFVIPLFLLVIMVGIVFLRIGVISIQSNHVGAGVFLIVVALSLIAMLTCAVVRITRQARKGLRM